ncbi:MULTISPECIES: SAM-dependent methyltransferase [Cytobacillus]|uniref:SAM-dependent methyltransferase n=1 Tax=Cytobacillus kochii TaxID=859143 RepID=A0A248TLE3_9BACI|nr:MULTISPECIES: SAM-dependent methyltransferase [Cytobacillus]ASV69016.1 hypothetical protein CKF48_17955 [Cytobacillus kochii]MDQ0183745.1 SAM-dependent MidA family methyltransferase [Cytobacillus kochii]MEA1853082.1 SAM-dependent methyltransferase [Cytobacillus sp. OWB-43]MED1607371.1 SAM-dependent methyltransferase [Cytobacillus kochii]
MNPIIRYIEENRMERLTYADFIQLALYHPDFGYYMKDDKKIGVDGDFYTSPTMTPMYATIIAKWFIEQVRVNQLPAAVLEIGAGDGSFAQVFINQWEEMTDESLVYILVDESPHHRRLQKDKLSKHHSVELHFLQSLDECHTFSGLVFSNELLDALPVHLVEKKDDCLYEIMITSNQNGLTEVYIPIENQEIISYIEQMSISLYNGQRMEIPLFMDGISASISEVLEKGLVLTADYGYTDDDWLIPTRKDGSLRGYRKHQLIPNILTHAGEMDITHDVHWDSWIRFGEKYGLTFMQKWRQDEFLIASGILDELSNHSGDLFSNEAKKNRDIRTLLMDSGISQSFQLVLQKKNL